MDPAGTVLFVSSDAADYISLTPVSAISDHTHVYVYLCMYVRTYLRTYVLIYTHDAQGQVHIYQYIHMYVRMYVCTVFIHIKTRLIYAQGLEYTPGSAAE